MLRRAFKPVLGTAVLVGAPSYFYYRYSTRPQTFDLPVREHGPDGKPVMTNRAIPLLSKEDVTARITEHAVYKATPRRGVVWKQATAHLAANNPIEDANTSTVIERDASDLAAPGDLLFFAVMDGHGGPHTSRLLTKVLIPAVTLELSSLVQDPKLAASQPGRFMSWFLPQSGSAKSDADPAAVSVAIQRAFSSLDAELVNAPLRILADYLSKAAIDKTHPPDLSKHPLALPSMQPAISGSCALMAMFDTAHRNLYVACTGDSRAVAGVYEEFADGQGTWRVEVLTEDQTGRNPNELNRIQSEHPPEEAGDVIRSGRVLGGLEPTRAFGDARYKWPKATQELLSKVFLEGNDQSMRAASPRLKTPPYVTSRPEVTHRKLALPADKSKSALRFLVLATDGLWDQLTSEEVVALVGGHLAGLKGAVPKTALPGLVRTSAGAPTVEGKDKRRKSGDGAWAFVDDNVGAHLIRNALGGADEGRLRRLLSIPAPYARSYRDDITVTVVWWEDEKESDTHTTAIAAEQAVKAKL